MICGEYQVFTSIAHAAHLPGRDKSLDRMMARLDAHHIHNRQSVHFEFGKAPPHVWSERQWRAALKPGFTHGLFLNDDLILADEFWEKLEDRIDQRPNDILSLYCSDPRAAELHAKGHRWYTSTDGLIGNAYIYPIWLLEKFLDWRQTALVPGVIETLSEDQLINLFAMATGRKIFHTIPSLVEHDVSIASAYGNEGNAARTASVGIDAVVRYPQPDEPTPDLGRFFLGNHRALLTHIKPEFWTQYNCVRRYYQIDGKE